MQNISTRVSPKTLEKFRYFEYVWNWMRGMECQDNNENFLIYIYFKAEYQQ